MNNNNNNVQTLPQSWDQNIGPSLCFCYSWWKVHVAGRREEDQTQTLAPLQTQAVGLLQKILQAFCESLLTVGGSTCEIKFKRCIIYKPSNY